MTDVMDTRELDALLSSISDALSPEQLTGLLVRVGDRIGTIAESHAAEYPPEPGGRPLAVFYDRIDVHGKPFKSKFKSYAQQGKVFSLINQGKIPRTRTGRLGNSITHETTVVDTGVVVQVGTNLGYGPVVLGDEGEQSHYHAETGWEPLQEKVDQYVSEYQDAAVDVVRAYVAGFMGGSK